MMKTLSLALICFLVFSCSSDKERTINPQTVQAQGGVDVGNMSSTVGIPLTQAFLSYPEGWDAKVENNVLTITNAGSSTIKALRSEITEVVAPTQTALINYLNEKYSDRIYTTIEINGMKGVRAEITSTAEHKVSDIYLVSELHDFIHIVTDLYGDNSGFIEGEQIIQTTRLKYFGEAIKDSATKTIKFEGENRFYSISEECFESDDQDVKKCAGIRISFNSSWLYVGSENSRVVDLGSEKELAFDSVRIEEEFLVSPMTKTPIADIYSTFTPQKQVAEQAAIKTKIGHTYLIRTVDWPNEDIITKLTIRNSSQGFKIVTYQKLISVSKENLRSQVELINRYTRENEMPLAEGEVTLYNLKNTNNSAYAGFNFHYSSSGNRYIDNGNWDVTFYWSTITERPILSVNPMGLEFYNGEGTSGIVDLGNKKLKDISTSDFPQTFSDNSFTPEIGKSYGIFHHRNASTYGAIYGAVKVLDVDENFNWIRLQFRRLDKEMTAPTVSAATTTASQPAVKKQEIEDAAVPEWTEEDHQAYMEQQAEEAAAYNVLIDKDRTFYFRYTNIGVGFESTKDGDVLVLKDPKGESLNLGYYKSISDVPLQDIMNPKYNTTNRVSFKKGDVVAFTIQEAGFTYFTLRIDEHRPGKSVIVNQLTYRPHQ